MGNYWKTPEEMGLSSSQVDEIVEKLWEERKESFNAKCPDCGAKPKEHHIEGCDVARCTSCGHQRLSCDCKDGEPEVWSGVWPGIKECYDQKLIAWDSKYLFWTFDLNTFYSRI